MGLFGQYMWAKAKILLKTCQVGVTNIPLIFLVDDGPDESVVTLATWLADIRFPGDFLSKRVMKS